MTFEAVKTDFSSRNIGFSSKISQNWTKNGAFGWKRSSAMASSKEYLDFVLDQLSGLDGITSRAMMGEFIIYYRGKVVGGIYDNRFLVKSVKAALSMMPEAELELPYEGGNKMLLVDDLENREFLHRLIESVYNELPEKGRK